MLDKFAIQYQFNNDNDWTTKENLLAKITNYQANNNQNTFGILQLWNNQAGVQIKTQFVDADNGDTYQIQLVDPQQAEKILNTENIITTIDFSAVLNWLKSFQIPISELANNQIEIKIPAVQAANTPFNNKAWSAVESAFQNFGIIIEYSKNLANGTETWGPLSNVNEYNPQSPTFKIRFRPEVAKAKNIRLKLENPNTILNGATAQPSKTYILQLKARLLVAIDPAFLAQFVRDANITGDTKFIKITAAQTAQQTLISAIINANKANDNRYEQLDGQLELQFVMQRNQPNEQAPWKTLNEFQTYLAQLNDDQTSNQIWYKIILKDKQNFNISSADEQPKVLSSHQASTAADLKILYYVNGADWEQRAAKVQISGPSNNLVWNFETAFGQNKVQEQADEVYLITTAGQALKMYFIIDNPNAQYTRPDNSDNPAEIRTKWVSKKPRAIPPGTTSVKIKLVANTGFVYGPATANPATAQAHSVGIKVQNILIVNKNWFNQPLINQEKEISALNATDFQNWENQIYQLIQQTNQTNEQTAKKVKIKYILANNNQQQYSSQELLDKINDLRTNYNDATTLGIVNLWNQQASRGTKIEAIFTIDPADQVLYALRAQGNQNEPTETELKGLVDTSRVYTSISLREYIEVLKNNKTTVTLPANGNPGDIEAFVPPKMPGQIGTSFLSGYTFEQITKRLAAVGIQVKFAKKASDNAADWKNQNEIKSYNIQTSVLFLSFEIENNANVRIQTSTTETLRPGQNMRGAKAIKLPLDVPKYIIIDQSKDFWTTIKDDFNFRGNTKFIEFDQQQIQGFIQKILQANFDASNDNAYQTAPL